MSNEGNMKNNIETIIDDTDENFSSKIKKMNLIGAPYQIIIGKQTEGDLIEFKEVGKETKKLKIGLPYLLDTDIGPLIDIEAKKRILKHLNRFKEKINQYSTA